MYLFFNAHFKSDSETRKGMSGIIGEDSLNSNGRSFLHFCASNGLSNHILSINLFTSIPDIGIHWDRSSLIDFMIVSSNLENWAMEVRVKRGAELSTDHLSTITSLGLWDWIYEFPHDQDHFEWKGKKLEVLSRDRRSDSNSSMIWSIDSKVCQQLNLMLRLSGSSSSLAY